MVPIPALFDVAVRVCVIEIENAETITLILLAFLDVCVCVIENEPPASITVNPFQAVTRGHVK